MFQSSQAAEGTLGFKGERGYSAYEIDVQHGYEGTEEEWLEHLAGELSDYVSTDDVVDNLTSTYTTRPLSANQGKVLKDLVDSKATPAELTALENEIYDNVYTKSETNSLINSVVTTGTNTNGSYVKFNDGTMIQWGRYQDEYAANISYGAVYRSDVQQITLPTSFINTNYRIFANTVAPLNSVYLVDNDKTVSTASFYAIAYLSRETAAFNIDFIAIGKWK